VSGAAAAHGHQEARQVRQPGHAVTGDRTRRSRRVGWEFAHSIVDDCSRLSYSEIHDDEQAPTVTAFTERALDFFADHGVLAERLMTDNAFAYIHNRGLRELLYRRAIRHLRTRPYTPRTNGKVERYPTDPPTRMGLRARIRLQHGPPDLTAHWMRHYNERRTHSALGNRPPLTRVREVTGLNT
jgi:transposase InsO family protein